MGGSSFIIRFIDIGLIILFGFLIISDITVRSELDLSGSDQSETQNEPKQQQLLLIRLLTSGEISVTDVRSTTVLKVVKSKPELESILSGIRTDAEDRDESVVALVEFDYEIIIQEVIEVLDICDRLDIPKNLNIESVSF